MTKKIFFFLICFSSFFSFGQVNSSIDEMLLKKYSKVQLDELKIKDPVTYNNYILSFGNGVSITTYIPKKNGNPIDKLSINAPEDKPFNYLDNGLDLTYDTQMYLINDGKSLLVIKGTHLLNYKQ
jgi:hypothetical protein